MTEKTDEKQRPPHLFKPGQSGNPAGRPKGARNRLGEKFISALADDFDEHGIVAIQTVRSERPHEYLKVVASLLPKEINLSVENDLTDDELDQRIRQLASALSLEIGIGEPAKGKAEAGGEKPAGDVQSVH